MVFNFFPCFINEVSYLFGFLGYISALLCKEEFYMYHLFWRQSAQRIHCMRYIIKKFIYIIKISFRLFYRVYLLFCHRTEPVFYIFLFLWMTISSFHDHTFTTSLSLKILGTLISSFV